MKRPAVFFALIVSLVLALFLFGGVAPFSVAAEAKSRTEALEAAAERLVQIVDEEELSQLFGLLEKMKDAGLSWNGEITVPRSGIVACKTPDQLYVLWGMYALDVTYANLFGKKIEEILAARMELEERIGYPRDLPIPRLKDNSDHDAKKKGAIAYLRMMIEESKKNPVLLNTFLGGFYGSTLELFYLFSKLGIAAGVTPEFVELVDVHLPQLRITFDMLDACSGDGELAQLLDVENRKAVVTSIMTIVKEKMGNITEEDLRNILAIVEMVRNPLVAPCN